MKDSLRKKIRIAYISVILISITYLVLSFVPPPGEVKLIMSFMLVAAMGVSLTLEVFRSEKPFKYLLMFFYLQLISIVMAILHLPGRQIIFLVGYLLCSWLPTIYVLFYIRRLTDNITDLVFLSILFSLLALYNLAEGGAAQIPIIISAIILCFGQNFINPGYSKSLKSMIYWIGLYHFSLTLAAALPGYVKTVLLIDI